jgi:hypothetical protein
MTGAEILPLWQILGILFGICGTLVAPVIWYSKQQYTKSEERTQRLVETVTDAQSKASKEARDDIKEFRLHFDKRIGEIYTSIDTKNKELRDHINTEMTYIKNLINDIENKIDLIRERNHDLEKEIMRVENDFQKNFVSREHFDAIIKLQGKLKSDV